MWVYLQTNHSVMWKRGFPIPDHLSHTLIEHFQIVFDSIVHFQI